MKKRFMLFIFSLFLSGCATSNLVWYHPNKTLEEAQQEAYDCEYRAKSLAYTRANQYPYDSSAGLGGAMASGVMSGAIQGSTMNSEYRKTGSELFLKNRSNPIYYEKSGAASNF